jgi:hypothetical protein
MAGEAQLPSAVEHAMVVDGAVEQAHEKLVVAVKPLRLTPSLRAAALIPAASEAVMFV